MGKCKIPITSNGEIKIKNGVQYTNLPVFEDIEANMFITFSDIGSYFNTNAGTFNKKRLAHLTDNIYVIYGYGTIQAFKLSGSNITLGPSSKLGSYLDTAGGFGNDPSNPYAGAFMVGSSSSSSMYAHYIVVDPNTLSITVTYCIVTGLNFFYGGNMVFVHNNIIAFTTGRSSALSTGVVQLNRSGNTLSLLNTTGRQCGGSCVKIQDGYVIEENCRSGGQINISKIDTSGNVTVGTPVSTGDSYNGIVRNHNRILKTDLGSYYTIVHSGSGSTSCPFRRYIPNLSALTLTISDLSVKVTDTYYRWDDHGSYIRLGNNKYLRIADIDSLCLTYFEEATAGNIVITEQIAVSCDLPTKSFFTQINNEELFAMYNITDASSPLFIVSVASGYKPATSGKPIHGISANSVLKGSNNLIMIGL